MPDAEKTRARHTRETSAKAAKLAGGSNRETIRQVKRVTETFVDGQEKIVSGEYSISKLYSLARGDSRVGLFVKIPPELRERIREAAEARGATMADVVVSVLTQIFGEAA